MTTETLPIEKPKETIWDLLIYLAGGFGLFILASIGVGYLSQNASSQIQSLEAYILNGLFLGGAFFFWAVLRKKSSFAEIGFAPARLSWKWLGIAIAISIVLIPLRGVIGFIIQMLLGGGMEGMQGRMELISAGGDLNWVNFLMTFAGAAIIAPISEELYFRGLIHRFLIGRVPLWARLLISSTLFGLGHIDALGVVVASFIMGVVNAYLFERSKTIWVPIVMHMITNGLAVLLMYGMMYLQQALGFPISTIFLH